MPVLRLRPIGLSVISSRLVFELFNLTTMDLNQFTYVSLAVLSAPVGLCTARYCATVAASLRISPTDVELTRDATAVMGGDILGDVAATDFDTSSETLCIFCHHKPHHIDIRSVNPLETAIRCRPCNFYAPFYLNYTVSKKRPKYFKTFQSNAIVVYKWSIVCFYILMLIHIIINEIIVIESLR